MADEDLDTSSTKPAGSMVPLLLGINSVALIAVLAVVLLRPSGSGAAKASEEKPAAHAEAAAPGGGPAGPTLRLADFTARLHEGEADHYARISLEIEVPTDKDKEELVTSVPRIRDNFIAFFADSSMEDLTGSAAIAKTKEKLASRLRETVPGQKVRGLYITDLVIQ